MATNWWVHRFLSGGVYTFQVNHVATMFGEEARMPNDNVGYSLIATAESTGLGALGPGTGSNWYIQRINGTSSIRYFKIHHDSTVPDKCPSSGASYADIATIVSNQCMSYFYNNGTCKSLGMYEASRSKSKPKRKRHSVKSTRARNTKSSAKVRPAGRARKGRNTR